MRLEKFEIMKRIKHIADQTNEGCVNADLENLLSILKDADHIDVGFIPKCYEGHKLRSHVLVDRGDFKALVHWTEARDNLKGLESEAV
tara:strand:- start:231 stop:494 length:264 start_codon:yes stop_codon:yes gene_type:complete